jgi:hypothetical protein
VTTKGRLELPRRSAEIEQFATEMTGLAKVLETDKATGASTYRYRKLRDDHYFHAFGYYLMAAKRTSQMKQDFFREKPLVAETTFNPLEISICDFLPRELMDFVGLRVLDGQELFLVILQSINVVAQSPLNFAGLPIVALILSFLIEHLRHVILGQLEPATLKDLAYELSYTFHHHINSERTSSIMDLMGNNEDSKKLSSIDIPNVSIRRSSGLFDPP